MQGSENPPPDGKPQRAEGQDSEKSTVEPKINSCSQLLLTNSMCGNRPEREVDLSSLLDCPLYKTGSMRTAQQGGSGKDCLLSGCLLALHRP